jgi:sugar phosphate isomerase/epimerase
MMESVKIGACDWALPGDGLYAPRIAAEFGLDVLSLKIGLLENNYPIAEDVMQRYYLEEQQRYGIEYCAIALNDFDNFPMHARENTKEYAIARKIMDKGIKAAVGLHASVIQIPNINASKARHEEDLEYLASAFRYICDEAGPHGIQVASENVMPTKEFMILYDLVNRPNFGVYYDSQNYHLHNNYDQVEILEGLYDFMLPQLHVKDGNGALSGALLGKGDTNFYGTMDYLKRRSYNGYILLENYYDRLPLRLENEEQNPYELLKEDISILKEAIVRKKESDE